MLTLLDTITTLAEAVDGELARAEYVDILMPPLIHKWNSLTDSDRDLFPLLEVTILYYHSRSLDLIRSAISAFLQLQHRLVSFSNHLQYPYLRDVSSWWFPHYRHIR